MADSETPLTELFGAAVGLLSANIIGHELSFGVDGSVAVTVSRLSYTPIMARPLPRLERQADRARRIVDASLFDPLNALRRGAEFVSGAIEETIGALQDLPFDATMDTIDILDDLALSVSPITAPSWSISTVSITANKVSAVVADAASSFNLALDDVAVDVTLTATEIVAIVDAQLRQSLRSRVTDGGHLMIDLKRAGKRLSASCELSAVDGSLVAEITHGLIFGRRFRLPRRYRRRQTVELTGFISQLRLDDLALSAEGVVMHGSTPRWTHRVSPSDVQALSGQLSTDTG